jgi:CBS domain-containing protein
MNIASICRCPIVTIDSAGSLTEAAILMREHHVGALVVTHQAADGLYVSGVVTDRDLVIDVLACELDGAGVEIGDLASSPIVSVSEDADLSDAIVAMQDSGVRRLLVTNDEEQLTGIVSFDDLMAACAREVAGLAQVIRSGIEREFDETAEMPLPTPQQLLRVPAMGTAGWGHAAA